MNSDTPRQLKAFRTRNGITQTDLARSLGCSLPTIQRWESGRTRCPAYLKPALAALEMEWVFERLVGAVAGCRREDGRFLTRIQVNEPLARALLSWSRDDWAKRFRGILDGPEVKALAHACLAEGFTGLMSHPFAPGTTLEILGSNSTSEPVLEVRKSLPPVRKQSLLGRILRRDSSGKGAGFGRG